MKNQRNGLIVLLLIVIIGCVYIGLKKQSSTSINSNQTGSTGAQSASSMEHPLSGWNAYMARDYGFEIQYPPNWTVSRDPKSFAIEITNSASSYSFAQGTLSENVAISSAETTSVCSNSGWAPASISAALMNKSVCLMNPVTGIPLSISMLASVGASQQLEDAAVASMDPIGTTTHLTLFTPTIPPPPMTPSVPSSLIQNAPTDWQTYSNPEYGFQIQYPVGSKITDTDITGGRSVNINSIDGTITNILVQDPKLVGNYSPVQIPCNDNGYYTSGTLNTYNDVDFVQSDDSADYGGMTSAAYAEAYCIIHNNIRYMVVPRIEWNRYSGSERGGDSSNTAPVQVPDKGSSFETFDQVMQDIQFTFTDSTDQ